MSIDGIYVYDLQLQTNVYINDRYSEITGYSREEITSLSAEDFMALFHPEDLPSVLAHIDDVVDHDMGASSEIRYRFRHKKGHWIWCQSRDAAFAHDKTGECTQFLGSFIDISELMESELRARDLGIMMAAMLENITLASFVIDKANQIHVFNSEAQNLLGVVPPEIPAPYDLNLTFAEKNTLSAVDDPIEQARNGIFHDNTVFALYPGDGKPLKYVRLTSIPLIGTTGDRVMIAMKDVTHDETNRQQRERSERLDALGQLTGGIAHDFNNVLASILPTVQVAKRLTQDPQSLKLLDIIENSANRGAQLAHRLLAFAKRQPVTEQDVNVSEMVASLKDIAQSTVGRQVAFHCEPVDKALFVHCDEAQLENALLNLIINARDAVIESGKGGQVTLATRLCDPIDQSGEMIEFSVTDDGPGMSEAVQARAFDPFFTTRSNTSGTGLGLSTVYGFANQAKGNVKLYSDKGIGTSVRLTLPVIRQETEEEEEQIAIADRQSWVKGEGSVVLVVEDETDLLNAMVEFLTILGFKPIAALNGELALAEMARRTDISILLTDIMMPGGMNGFELALAAREIQPDLKIIYMSGYTGFVSDERRQADGAFLQKPCDMDSLSKALHNALSIKSISA